MDKNQNYKANKDLIGYVKKETWQLIIRCLKVYMRLNLNLTALYQCFNNEIFILKNIFF